MRRLQLVIVGLTLGILIGNNAGRDLVVRAQGTLSAGDLDPTFGTGGAVVTDFGGGDDYANQVAVQPDGKMLVVVQSSLATDFTLARYNADGTLDSSFGTGGRVDTDFANSGDASFGIALQSDGKIVAVGASYQGFSDAYFAVARYNPDGTLDTSFDGDGKVITDFALPAIANSVAVQADGRIVVVGSRAVARYNGDGSLDATFDGDGKLTPQFSASAVVVDIEGRIVVAGNSGGNAAVARYNSDGSPDTTFSADGWLVADFSIFSTANTLGVQSDGKIVLAGHSVTSDFIVARYNTDGSLDSSFGGDGQVVTDFGRSEEAYGTAIQADGKIVIVGFTNASGNDDFAVARYNPDGSLDTSFSGDGKVSTHFGSTWEYAWSVAIQPDGKLVVAGLTYNEGSTGADVLLARYLGTTNAQEQIEQIIRDVQALVAARGLNRGQANALLVKLQHSIQRLDAGDLTTAVTSLQAFINQVNAFMSGGILTAAQGQPLINQAQAVIDQLG